MITVLVERKLPEAKVAVIMTVQMEPLKMGVQMVNLDVVVLWDAAHGEEVVVGGMVEVVERITTGRALVVLPISPVISALLL